MKSVRIRERKYRGYLIRPALTGFRVYRKGFYIAEYPTQQIAMARIDRVLSQDGEQPQPPPTSAGTGQTELF